MKSILIIMIATTVAIIASHMLATTPEAFIALSIATFSMSIVGYFIGYTWEHREK